MTARHTRPRAHDVVAGAWHPCPRCSDLVIAVHTSAPNIPIDLDADPLRDGDHSTPPWFERVDVERFAEVVAVGQPELIDGRPLHAVHHCDWPYLCRHCDHHHPQTTAANDGGDNTQGEA